jgi:simple sugar transport system permease protein
MTETALTTFINAKTLGLRRVFGRIGFIWVLLILTIVAGSFSSPVFLTVNNLFNILIASATLGCLVLAQAPVLLLGKFDLSTEANMIFVAILGTLVMTQPVATSMGSGVFQGGGLGLAWPLGIATMVLVAAFVGLLNGLMIIKLRMNAFMTTLAVSIILGGLALFLSEGRTLFDLPPAFRWVGSAKIGPAPVAAIFLLLMFGLAHIFLSRTVFGRRLYAVGSSPEAARASGIDVDRVAIVAYVLCGALSGIAAFILVGRLGTASAGISNGALFLSIAAAVIGGVSLFGGQGTAAGMLGGLLIISVINNAMNLAAIPANMIRIVAGAAILLAVFVDALRRRAVSKR